jgi:aminoglycoside/choline kinase family phosphotransferase
MAVAPEAPARGADRRRPHRGCYLSGIGDRVPGLRAWDQEARFVVLQDRGDEMLTDRLTAADAPRTEALYRAAIDTLVGLPRESALHPDPTCVAFQRRFDAHLLRAELHHFLDWGVPGADSAHHPGGDGTALRRLGRPPGP